MPDDIFRLILLVGFSGIIAIGIVHGIRSHRLGEKLDLRKEGWPMLIGLRLVAVARGVAIAGFIINPKNLDWSRMEIPLAWRWVGVGLGAAGGWLLLWTFLALGKNLTDTVITRRDHQLVTHGPYRWVRHPFYAAFALAVPADGLMTSNWYVLLLGIALISLLAFRTRREESFLIDKFGEEYRAYAARTGRFFPKIGAG